MSGVQWIGLILFLLGAGSGITYLIVAWGTREERRRQTELRTPRFIVRFDDYLRSVGDCRTQQ